MENCETPRAPAEPRARAEPCGAGQRDGMGRDTGMGRCGTQGWGGAGRAAGRDGTGQHGLRAGAMRVAGVAAPRSGPAPPGATPPKLCAGKAQPGECECGPGAEAGEGGPGSSGRGREGAAAGAGASRQRRANRGELGSITRTPGSSDRAAETHAAISLSVSSGKQTNKQTNSSE